MINMKGFDLELENGERFSGERVEKIGNEICEIFKRERVPLTAAETILDEVKSDLRGSAVII